jgi:hypothetical protein
MAPKDDIVKPSTEGSNMIVAASLEVLWEGVDEFPCVKEAFWFQGQISVATTGFIDNPPCSWEFYLILMKALAHL